SRAYRSYEPRLHGHGGYGSLGNGFFGRTSGYFLSTHPRIALGGFLPKQVEVALEWNYHSSRSWLFGYNFCFVCSPFFSCWRSLFPPRRYPIAGSRLSVFGLFRFYERAFVYSD